MYAVRLRFSDGHDASFAVAPEQTVLEAAMQIDAPLRYDCASGECGACIAKVVEGRTIFDVEGPSPITAAEAADGLRPTCQTRLASDAVLDLPYALYPQPSAPARHAVEVRSVERVSSGVFRLELSRPEGFDFQPGQYVRLRPPGAKAARAFSISSDPADPSRLEFLIRRLEAGLVSSWLEARAAAGDRVVLQGPLGSFAFDAAATRHVFVVGGTGLAPALSMLRARPTGARALVCFGVNTLEDLFCTGEMDALRAEGCEVRIAVNGGDPGAHSQGDVLSLLTPVDLALDATAYLCGPPGMVAAGRALIEHFGVSPSRIRAERYLVGG